MASAASIQAFNCTVEGVTEACQQMEATTRVPLVPAGLVQLVCAHAFVKLPTESRALLQSALWQSSLWLSSMLSASASTASCTHRGGRQPPASLPDLMARTGQRGTRGPSGSGSPTGEVANVLLLTLANCVFDPPPPGTGG